MNGWGVDVDRESVDEGFLRRINRHDGVNPDMLKARRLGGSTPLNALAGVALRQHVRHTDTRFGFVVLHQRQGVAFVAVLEFALQPQQRDGG